MKPDWKDAPEWAKYLAIDANDDWWWFENEPYISECCGEWHDPRGRIKCARLSWRDSLEERPNESNTPEEKLPLEKAIERLCNCYCLENESNTPDFILAEYIIAALQAYNRAVNAREKWYGR